MGMQYTCPKCSSVLNPSQKIILLGRFNSQDVLVAFHPEPGNYEISMPVDTAYEAGNLWEFFCPLCHENLNLAGSDTMAALTMVDGLGNDHKVVFSRVAGERVTFVLSHREDKGVEEYGPDLSNYRRTTWVNFI